MTNLKQQKRGGFFLRENAALEWKGMACKFIFFLFLLFFGMEAFGQMSIQNVKDGHYGTTETRTSQIDQMMREGLSLTSAQIPVVHEINFRYSERVENEVVSQKISDWTRYRRLMKIQKAKDKELKAVFTADQFEKYVVKRDQMFWEGVKAFFF